MKIRVGVLISGTGTNLKALILAAQRYSSPAEIVSIGSNKLGVPGLDLANVANIPYFVVQAKTNRNNEKLITRKFREERVDLICLAGYMKIVSTEFINEWDGRILNIHPSLLPSFKGLDAQKQALEHGVKLAGCTVHYVVPEMDAGPILGQRSCPVLDDDNVETLSERILDEEHKLYPEVLNKVAKEMLESFSD